MNNQYKHAGKPFTPQKLLKNLSLSYAKVKPLKNKKDYDTCVP